MKEMLLRLYRFIGVATLIYVLIWLPHTYGELLMNNTFLIGTGATDPISTWSTGLFSLVITGILIGAVIVVLTKFWQLLKWIWNGDYWNGDY